MQMQIELRISGLKQIVLFFTRWRKKDVLRGASQKAGNILLNAAASYPAYTQAWRRGRQDFSSRRPGSKYIRTRALGRSWQLAIRKTGFRGYAVEVFTNYNVALYTHGDDTQTSSHAAWWLTESQIVDSETDFITKVFEEESAKALR